MGLLSGKVAFITGAARGQGRAHAIRLAEEGADIIAVDITVQPETVPYPVATSADLAQTVNEVESLGRRIVAAEADVRDLGRLKTVVDDAVARLGRLDIVAANAGIFSPGLGSEMSEETWQEMIDINLTGVWKTCRVSIPHLRASGGGSIVITSSTAGLRGIPNLSHYAAAKHGVVGLMRTFALELAVDNIRVNTVHPTGVDTEMIQNEALYALFAPDLDPAERTREALAERIGSVNALDVPWIEPRAISNAVLWLASDEARYITGVALPVDAGAAVK